MSTQKLQKELRKRHLPRRHRDTEKNRSLLPQIFARSAQMLILPEMPKVPKIAESESSARSKGANYISNKMQEARPISI